MDVDEMPGSDLVVAEPVIVLRREISPLQARAVVEVLHQSGLGDVKPDEEPVQTLRRLLPPILEDLEVRDRPLTPLEATIFQLPDNAFERLFAALGFEGESLKEYRKGSHQDRAKRLARLFVEDASAAAVIRDMMYASQVTVQQYMASVPPGAEVIAALSKTAGYDLQNPPPHTANQSDEKRPRAVPIHAAQISDDTTAITYMLAQAGQPVLGADNRVISTVRQRLVVVLTNHKTGVIEARGAASDTEKVVSQFRHDARVGGAKLELAQLKLTQDEMRRLVEDLGGKVLREKFRPDDAESTGFGSTEHSCADGIEDLRDAPGYQALSERTITRWRAAVPHAQEEYNIEFGMENGTIRFTKGDTPGAFISMVLARARAIRAGA